MELKLSILLKGWVGSEGRMWKSCVLLSGEIEEAKWRTVMASASNDSFRQNSAAQFARPKPMTGSGVWQWGICKIGGPSPSSFPLSLLRTSILFGWLFTPLFTTWQTIGYQNLRFTSFLVGCSRRYLQQGRR